MGNSCKEDESGCLEAWVQFEIVEKGCQRHTRAGAGNMIVSLGRQLVSMPEIGIYERQTDDEKPKKATLKYLDMNQ